MANIIQRYDHFEPSTVILSKMKKNKNGGKTVYINAPENKKLYIQLPFMRSPFGLSAFTDEATNKTSYSLDLSFDTDNEQANDLMEKLKQLDERIVKQLLITLRNGLASRIISRSSRRLYTSPWFVQVRTTTPLP